jgi:hypothetical protein
MGSIKLFSALVFIAAAVSVNSQTVEPKEILFTSVEQAKALIQATELLDKRLQVERKQAVNDCFKKFAVTHCQDQVNQDFKQQFAQNRQRVIVAKQWLREQAAIRANERTAKRIEPVAK